MSYRVNIHLKIMRDVNIGKIAIKVLRRINVEVMREDKCWVN